jgi:MoxR-like ATPase
VDPKTLLASLRNGRASIDERNGLRLTSTAGSGLAERLRHAYAWITEQALVCPYQDIELGEPLTLGPPGAQIELRASGFSSYVLMPLLTLATSQRLLFVGAPGRGKTTMATLAALLSGQPLAEVRRGIQHGHPQLTISDLLGSPLPADLIRAEEPGQIHVAWRRWLRGRVKIIDEYNRIPTKTQSALLSLMAEGYAEMFEQVIEPGKSAWFLTANDDLGGGTFQVIDALKDRIDAVVRCTPFHSRFLGELADRVAGSRAVGDYVPADIVFSPDELDRVEAEIRAIHAPEGVLDLLGFFAGQLDFCQRASDRLELRTKDTLHLAGRKVAHVCTEDCPLDKQVHLCTQTENGVSARAYQAIILYAKALAYFRGESSLGVEDVRQVLPWTLHEKLKVNPQSAFFQKAEAQVLLVDRISWIRQLFDRAVAQHGAFAQVRAPIAAMRRELEVGAAGMSAGELRAKAGEARQLLERVLSTNEASGPLHDDLVLLKRIHARFTQLAEQASGQARAGGPKGGAGAGSTTRGDGRT